MNTSHKLSVSTPTYYHRVSFTPMENGNVEISRFCSDSLLGMGHEERKEIVNKSEARAEYKRLKEFGYR